MLPALSLVLAAATGPHVPQPEPPPSGVRLSWAALEGCPDAASVGERVEQLLGDRTGSEPVDAIATIERDDQALTLHLVVVAADRREQRDLRAVDCELLSQAGALVIAVTVDALATATNLSAAEDEPESEPEAAKAPDLPGPDPSGRPVDVRVATESEGRGVQSPRPSSGGARWLHGLTLAARGGAAIGATPGVTGGAEGEIAWRFGPVRVEAGGFHWFRRRASLRADAGVRSALSGAAMRGCWAATRERLDVPLCAGVELGVMHGGGIGSAVAAERVRQLWVGVSAGAGIAYWLVPRVALDARVGAVLAARRPAMYLDDRGDRVEVFRMLPVGARFVAGVVIRAF